MAEPQPKNTPPVLPLNLRELISPEERFLLWQPLEEEAENTNTEENDQV